MILPLSGSADAWDLVRGKMSEPGARPAFGPVLIFCAAPDPDALVAARTLTALLRADLVRYELHPVGGYSQLRATFDNLVRGPSPVQPRAVLCINCGAKVDVAALLGLSSGLNADSTDDEVGRARLETQSEDRLAYLKIFVIDYHRPYHLRNVSSGRVCVFDDSPDAYDSHDLPLNVGWEDDFGNVRDVSSGEDEGFSTDDEFDEDFSSDGLDDDEHSGTQGGDTDGNDANDGHLDVSCDKLATRPISDGDSSESQDGAHDAESVFAPDRNSADARDGTCEGEKLREAQPSPARKPENRAKSAVVSDGEYRDKLNSNEALNDSDTDYDRTFANDFSDDTMDQRTAVRRRRTYPRHESKSRNGTKRKRKGRRSNRPRRRRRRHVEDPDAPAAMERRRLLEYYSSSSAGMASSCIAHNLALVLRRGTTETLWCGIIGITFQHLTSLIQPAVYADAVGYCRSQVNALAGPVQGESRNEQDGPVLNTGYTPAANGGAATQTIAPSTEYRLDLVRHWNLHDSLLYSAYTITRLAAWRQSGRRRLMEMLATLGIPLKESQQRWCYMRGECKAALDERLPMCVRRFDLGRGIQYDSFVRTLPGHRGNVSAADVVYGLSALLELDGLSLDTPSEQSATANDTIDDGLYYRFWRAYDSLDTTKPGALKVGFNIAIMSQRITAEIGGEIIERRRFVPSGPFRYVFLRDLQCKELFAHPLLLKRLALFLIDALTRQGARDKPFLVIAPETARGVWLAVAAMNVGVRNDFGQRFTRAAEKNGCKVSFVGFDSAVCEIQDGQETEFIRYLHDVMV